VANTCSALNNDIFYLSLFFWRVCPQQRGLKVTMKAAAIRRRGKTTQPVRRFRRVLASAAGLKLGVEYWRAAERDEKSGLPYTAAMEWHKAAELFSAIPQVSNRCWQEWERIMHLPRRFVRPIVNSAEVSPQYLLSRDSHKITKPVVTRFPPHLLPNDFRGSRFLATQASGI
jgi:hypothetical protein